MMYRNPEHYADPTAGQAIENIEKEEERMARQRRWGGRKHRRDGAHRFDDWQPRPGLQYRLVYGSPLPAQERGRLHMGSVTRIEDPDASSWVNEVKMDEEQSCDE